MEEAERSHILQTLQQTGGVLGGPNGAAARLSLPRTTLIAKMKRLRINGGRIETPPLNAFARDGASSGSSDAQSDVGRMYAPARPKEIHYAVSRGD
jgi:formate hydrogenlyase transcriptional activator